MPRHDLNDLTAFLAVARARSFTRAAAQLGVSQSALSHAMRALEERMGLRLLMRTTRSVSPTEAGERLLRGIGPHVEEIENELAALTALRDQPAGKVRITCTEHVAESVLWLKLARLLARYPDIKVEIVIDYGLTDIVAQRFDAGVRLGEQVAADMVAIPISPPLRMAAVAAPAYFKKNPPPKQPQDLTAHRCINLRLPTSGGVYVWEFEKGRRKLNVRVEGQVVFNSAALIVRAAIDGLGIAFTPETAVAALVAQGRLQRVLEDWCPPFPGYHLYYPSRRQSSPAFSLVVQALRWRG
ncbi:MAG: LysR family transcriptional regulator [Solimonas sp.]